MITEFFIRLFVGLVEWINSMWNGYDLDMPWLQDFNASFQSVIQWSDGLGVWADWVLFNNIVTAVFGVWVVVLVVKLALRIVSHVTGGGGAS